MFWSFGLLGSETWKQNTAYAGARGVRNVAFSSISHEQREKPSLLFSIFVGSLYYRRIPFIDYLERSLSNYWAIKPVLHVQTPMP